MHLLDAKKTWRLFIALAILSVMSIAGSASATDWYAIIPSQAWVTNGAVAVFNGSGSTVTYALYEWFGNPSQINEFQCNGSLSPPFQFHSAMSLCSPISHSLNWGERDDFNFRWANPQDAKLLRVKTPGTTPNLILTLVVDSTFNGLTETYTIPFVPVQ